MLDVWIVVEPIPGRKKANDKTALVRLPSAPNAPRHFELQGAAFQRAKAASALSAAESSARTAASSSTSKRSRKAAAVEGEQIRPSAQAACARTSGSESESAE